jgi:hypothetical protein
MTGVRNGPLARKVLSATGFTALGTVPPGMTWLVKTVHVQSDTNTEANVLLQLGSADGAVHVTLPRFVVAGQTGVLWQGWTALASGDDLVAWTDQAPVQIWVAGAELPGEIPAR